MLVTSAQDVATLVRGARTRRRMSQADLAVAAGVSRRWLIDLEAGKPRAELNMVLTVLRVLGVPLHAQAPDESTGPGGTGTGDADLDLDEHLARLSRLP